MTMRLDLSANPGADSIRDHIAELERELDAARARERHALVAGAEALRRIAAATPIGHEDVTKGPSTYNWLCYAASLLMAEAATTPATPLEQELITLRAREAKLREAAQAVVARWDAPLWKCVEPTAAVVNRLRADLAEGEDTQGVADSAATTQDTVVDGIDLNAVVALYRGDRLAMAHALVQIRNAAGALREQLEQRPA